MNSRIKNKILYRNIIIDDMYVFMYVCIYHEYIYYYIYVNNKKKKRKILDRTRVTFSKFTNEYKGNINPCLVTSSTSYYHANTRISGYEVYIQVPRNWWFHDHVTFLTCTVRLLRVRPVRRQKRLSVVFLAII